MSLMSKRFFEHSRTPSLDDLSENACHAAWRKYCETHASGEAIDLSVSNATQVGLQGVTPSQTGVMSAVLAAYTASPQGLAETRDAISRYYAEFGTTPSPEKIQLFASTSEAVGALIKLVCQPGDEVITFNPTYPLLDCLCSLESVSLKEVSLQDCAGEWDIDFWSLGQACSEKTRAVIVVSPNNPTGHCLRRAEFDQLTAFCAQKGLLLIVDEVFAGYCVVHATELVSQPAACTAKHGLVVSLSGLSKVCGLPQHKLGWGVFGGEDALVDEAMQRLSFITDSTLSVSGWVQHLAPELLARHNDFSAPCIERLKQNLAEIRKLESDPNTRWTLGPVHGGWSVCLRLPGWAGNDEVFATTLATRGIRVFPGSFFGYRDFNPTLVISLIVEPDTFKRGIWRLAEVLSELLS